MKSVRTLLLACALLACATAKAEDVACDAAMTINEASPWQFWFGIQHPF